MVEDKLDLKTQHYNGVTWTWDNNNNCFVKFPVNNVPKQCWVDWNNDCVKQFSGQRWVMIWSDHLKAKAYDNLVSMIGSEFQQTEDDTADESDKLDTIIPEKPMGKVRVDKKDKESD